MKNRKLIWVRLTAIVCASVVGPVAQSQQPVGSLTTATASFSEMNSAPPIVPKPLKHSRSQVLRGNIAYIKGSMVKEIEATSAAMQPGSHKSQGLDNWLIVLAAFGLIALQLRHKHKSLPQRQITPYG